MMDALEQARREIDTVDAQLAALFERRMKAVLSVAEYKKAHGLPIFDAAREKVVLDKAEARIGDPALRPYYRDHVQNMMDVAKQYEAEVLGRNRAAYQGVEGAFAHIALRALFPHAEAVSCPTWDEVFDAVEKGDAAHGVVPFENSHAGDVSAVLDLCYNHPGLWVVDVYDLPISQNLLVLPGTQLSDLTRVYSHQQAIAQSETFLKQFGLPATAMPNTAMAAKFVAESGDRTKAAIASVETAALYGLEVLVPSINTDGDNTTRFIVLSREKPTAGNRFSLLFTLDNKPGKLAEVIQVIGASGYDMESIKSRPLPHVPFDYYLCRAGGRPRRRKDRRAAARAESCLPHGTVVRSVYEMSDFIGTKLTMNLGERSYDIILKNGALENLYQFARLDRKVAVVTDSGVPAEYAQRVADQCRESTIITVPQGEASKSFKILETVLRQMLEFNMGRGDLVVAVGGGVVGDLAGFAAAIYMRGIDFINCPTTTLSMIDSSIGGKTAVDLGDTKNIVGAFWQPKLVIVDPATLSTLPRRHYINGLAEAVKAGLLADPELFAIFEKGDIDTQISEIIYRSLRFKKNVVEQDETERGMRKALNFGHTIGHGIEAVKGIKGRRTVGLFHGECVALGMLPMIESKALQKRVRAVYRRIGLPTRTTYNKEKVLAEMLHDKKAQGGQITVIKVPGLGCWRAETIPVEGLRPLLGVEE